MRPLTLLTLLLAAPPASAQVEPGWGFTWERVGNRPIKAQHLAFGPDGVLWAAGDSTRWLDRAAGPPGRWQAVPYWHSFSDVVLPLGGDTLVVVRGRAHRSLDRGVYFEEVAPYGAYTLYEVPAGAPAAGRLLTGTGQTTGTGAAFSDDRGATWALAPVTTPQSVHSMYAFAAVPAAATPPGVAARVVAGGDGGLYVSDDGGASWRRGPAPVFSYPTLRGEFALALERPSGGTRLLALFDVAQSPSIATATSDDGGQTWAMGPGLDEPAGTGLGWPNVDGLVRLGPSSALAVLGRGRVHRTDDGGLTWAEVAQTPRENEFVIVNAATLGPDGRLYVAMMRIGSSYEGAWVYRAAEVVVGEAPGPERSGLRLEVVPNPADSAAPAVRLTLGVAATVEAAAFDALGRRVAVLHDGAMAPGAHALTLDGPPLATGVYVVRVVARPAAGGPALVAVRRVAVVR